MIIIGGIWLIIQYIKKDEQNPRKSKRGTSTMKPLPPQSQNITSNHIKELRDEFDKKLSKYVTNTSFDSLVAKKVKELNDEIYNPTNNNKSQNIESLESRISELEARLKQLQGNSSSAPTASSSEPPKSRNNSTNPSQEKTKLPTTRPPVPTNSTTVNIVDVYNQNSASLSSDIEVLETTESIENRRLGVSQRPVIEKVRKNQGNYWVINVEGIYYLVPKAKLRVTEHTFSQLNILFDCHNYRDDYTKFTLIKPAEVSKSGDNCELKEKGILEFE